MNYTIAGKVIKGEGYGRKIGFPTVNLNFVIKDSLKAGVYSGSVIFNKKEYRAGIVIGPGEKVEAHLIGFRGNLYGKKVTIEVGKFLRKFKKFETEKELIAQIKKDLKKC